MTVVKNITAAALANNSDSQILLGTGTADVYKSTATVTQEIANPTVTPTAAKMTVASTIRAASDITNMTAVSETSTVTASPTAAKMTVAQDIVAAGVSKIYKNISKLCDKVVSVAKGTPNITAGLGVVALVPVRIRKENNYVRSN